MSHYVDRKRKVAFERVSEAKILSDLRPAAERLGEPLAINRYRKEAPRRGWVYYTAANRFGSWAEACQAAGVRSYPPRGRMRTSLFGERECLQALKSCSEELGRSPKLTEYVSRSAEHPEQPKAETIRSATRSPS